MDGRQLAKYHIECERIARWLEYCRLRSLRKYPDLPQKSPAWFQKESTRQEGG